MKLKYGWLVFVFLGFLASCTNDPNTLGLSNSTFTSDYRVIVVDTITIKVSTVLLDSFPTSNTGLLLIGGYNDSQLGRMDGVGYVQIGTGTTWSPPTDAVFDSLNFIAHYSGYAYGDTTINHTISVSRIVQPFQFYTLPEFWINENQYSSLYTSGSKFNSSAMRYDAQPLGTRTVRIRPHSKDSIVVRLNDDLGKEWLRLTKEQSPDLVEANRFMDYFKGISVNSANSANSVIGINTENLKIRLYYKTYVAEKLTQQYHDFTFAAGQYNYTRFISDRTDTPLSALSLANNAIPSENTNGMSFVQSGSGLVTKLTFPYLTKLLRLTNVLLVNQAQLIIEPVKDSFTAEYPLPSSLTLYYTDKTNLPLKRVTANYNANAYQTATISFDNEFDTSTGYQFTVTQLAQSLLSTEASTDRGLLVMPTVDELSKSAVRAYFGHSGNYRVKLKVWYTKSN